MSRILEIVAWIDLAKLPLVIFESHLGYGATCWGYLQKHLEGLLPTLAYQRCGYGWSKELEDDSERSAEQLALELRLLLEELQYDQHPIILVGHSFGAVISRAYKV